MEVRIDDLRAALGQAANEVVGFLRGGGVDPHALTEGGEWTLRDTAAHLIGITRLYTRMLDGQPSPLKATNDVAVMNAGIFLGLVEDRPSVLADLVDNAADALLQASRRGQQGETRPFHFGAMADVARLVAAPCYEYLLHGADMMWAVGQPWSCPERAAEATFGYIFLSPTITGRLDAHEASEVDATFSVGCDDHCRFCVQVRSGNVALLPSGTDAECAVTGTASQLLLWLSGRKSWEDAELTAQGRLANLAPLFAAFLTNG
jgi:uncharacterized protein (TIGR03083 family)